MRTKGIGSILFKQARKTPDIEAIRCGDQSISYNELNDKDNNSLEIQDIFQHIVKKIKFESITINENFQIYCFDNISNITIHKGIQKDSFIAFIKKK